jgi:hypothetical protein
MLKAASIFLLAVGILVTAVSGFFYIMSGLAGEASGHIQEGVTPWMIGGGISGVVGIVGIICRRRQP